MDDWNDIIRQQFAQRREADGRASSTREAELNLLQERIEEHKEDRSQMRKEREITMNLMTCFMTQLSKSM